MPATLLSTLGALLALQAAPQLPLEPPSHPLQHLDWEQGVRCAFFAPTRSVPSGEYRLQCDEEKHLCLASPTHELDGDGVETGEPLAETRSCSYEEVDWAARIASGWRFVPAIAEAPPGWYRDARGRVMQHNFDLNRRVYLGAGWSPLWLARDGTPGMRNRFRADFGVDLEFPDDEGDTLFRMHLLKGEAFAGDESGVTLTTFSWDWSHTRRRPVAGVGTFVGTPAKVELDLNLGGYLEALRVDNLHRQGVTQTDLMLATAQPTFDLWHSRDLVSYLRVRGGPGLSLDTIRGHLYLLLEAALEGDFTLDTNGFHHLRLRVQGDQSFFGPDAAGRAHDPSRLSGRLEYELVFLTINDQPLSLVLDGRGGWRNDLAWVTPGWEWAAGAALRFSLWAPPRRPRSH